MFSYFQKLNAQLAARLQSQSPIQPHYDKRNLPGGHSPIGDGMFRNLQPRGTPGFRSRPLKEPGQDLKHANPLSGEKVLSSEVLSRYMKHLCLP